MNEVEARKRIESSTLMCHTETHFYFIDALPNVPLEQQARDNGELNAHIIRITTPFQRVLWERRSVLDEEVLDV